MNRTSPRLRQALIPLTLLGTLCAPASVLAGTAAPRANAPASAHAHPAQKGTATYRTHLRMQPAPAQAGQQVTLTLTVRDEQGRAVTRLTPSHEKPMHLFLVSKDLRHFAHVHPSLDGDSFRVQHTFAAAGDYTLFVDYQQPGRGQVVDRHDVHVEGAAPPVAPTLTESPRTQRADGLEVTLRGDAALRAGQAALLHFDVTDAATGKPVVDLEPYLGAMAHFMVLSADMKDFVHVHALDTRDSASRVSAHAVFPRAGLYKLWAQVQRHGEVATVPFVVRVDAASGPGGHAQHHHQH